MCSDGQSLALASTKRGGIVSGKHVIGMQYLRDTEPIVGVVSFPFFSSDREVNLLIKKSKRENVNIAGKWRTKGLSKFWYGHPQYPIKRALERTLERVISFSGL